MSELPDRVRHLQELLLRLMSGGSADELLPISEAEDDLDAIASGINILLAELRYELDEQHRLREKLDRVFHTLADGIAVVGAGGRIDQVNDALCALFGYGAEDLVGQELGMLYRDPQTATSLLQRARIEGHVEEADRACRHQSGELIEVTLTASSMPIAEVDREPRVLWVVRDVRQLRRALEEAARAAVDRERADQLERAHARLEEALEELRSTQDQLVRVQKLEAMGRLAGGIAHDFNNLLLVITSSAEFLRPELTGEPEALEDLSQISAAAARAKELTQQLLAISRRQPNQPQRLDINEVLRRAEAMLRRVVEATVELRMELAEGLWVIEADPGQIEQVVVNLVMNARDAIEDQGRVTLRTENVEDDHGKHVLLIIEDDGSGMSPEVQQRALEPFFTTKEQGRGTGLGLSVCYGIVKQSSGELNLKSQLGKGTRVEVAFPTAVGHSEAVGDASVGRAPGGSETVLVAEDQHAVRAVMVRVLSELGYRVLEAQDGLEAAELLEASPAVDLLVTDMVMPRLGGKGLAARAREKSPDLPIVFVSGYADEYPDTAADRGRSVILPKPFQPEDLARSVRKLLDG